MSKYQNSVKNTFWISRRLIEASPNNEMHACLNQKICRLDAINRDSIPRLRCVCPKVFHPTPIYMCNQLYTALATVLVLTLIFLSSCELAQVDEFSSEAQPEFAVPLVSGSFTLEEILDNFDEYTEIEIDADGLIHLRYYGQVLEQTGNEILQGIKDSIPNFLIFLDTSQTIPLQTVSGLDIDLISIKSGRMDAFFICHSFTETVEVRFEIPELIRPNGTSYDLNLTIPYNGSGQSCFPLPLSTDLAGYELRPSADGLTLRYDARLPDDTRVELDQPLIWPINDLVFGYAEGYLGQYIQEGIRDTIEIEFFENWVQGEVYFEEPTIGINIENSFGMPARSQARLFDILTADGQTLPLTGPPITDGIDFAYPTINEVGQVKSTFFEFDSDNSNIDVVLGSQPIGIDYIVDAVVNPDMDTSITGFITDTSRYRVFLDVDLPMYGSASGFVALDTFDLNFADLTEVASVEFKSVTTNETGVEIAVQGYFLGNNGQVIDSLFEGSEAALVAAAAVDSEGYVLEPNKAIEFATFDAVRFGNIRSARQLAIRVYFSTVNNGSESIRLLKDQKVDVGVGMKVKLAEL